MSYLPFSPLPDLQLVAVFLGLTYPSLFDKICKDRQKHARGNALGLTQFGVNLTRLASAPLA